MQIILDMETWPLLKSIQQTNKSHNASLLSPCVPEWTVFECNFAYAFHFYEQQGCKKEAFKSCNNSQNWKDDKRCVPLFFHLALSRAYLSNLHASCSRFAGFVAFVSISFDVSMCRYIRSLNNIYIMKRERKKNTKNYVLMPCKSPYYSPLFNSHLKNAAPHFVDWHPTIRTKFMQIEYFSTCTCYWSFFVCCSLNFFCLSLVLLCKQNNTARTFISVKFVGWQAYGRVRTPAPNMISFYSLSMWLIECIFA